MNEKYYYSEIERVVSMSKPLQQSFVHPFEHFKIESSTSTPLEITESINSDASKFPLTSNKPARKKKRSVENLVRQLDKVERLLSRFYRSVFNSITRSR